MSYTAGAVVRSTVTFVPASGSVDVENVTARAILPDGTTAHLTPAAGAANVFTADYTIPDTAIDGPLLIRWECSSPKIVAEVGDTIAASAMLDP